MNRLVIVGNGFDLAHGLPTGYCDFIDWYWRKLAKSLYDSEVTKYKDELVFAEIEFLNVAKKSIDACKIGLNDISSLDGLQAFLNKTTSEYTSRYANSRINIYNSFFSTICSQRNIQNWVDIENEYYKLLTKILRGLKEGENNSKVKKLNEEFDQVKQLLERYLNEEVCSKLDFSMPNKHSEKFIKNFIVKPRLFEGSRLLDEFPEKDHLDIKEEDENIRAAYSDRTLLDKIWNGKIKEKNLFLNFNYTFTLDYHTDFMNTAHWHHDAYGIATQIQIHGRLNDPDNTINFGFGDEMDKHYQEIEEKDDNEYLKYIKSFQYLQNSNYKRVLDFIDGEKFQVYIMGHSCGLSDRILLNTIFEHENCRSIKVFYYKNGDWDNYTEIVQNISRHFNKKKLMRDKIVNKSLCQPLPQDIRFEEK